MLALLKRRRKPGESILSFAYALRTLADQAFGGPPTPMVENMLLIQFYEGLSAKIKGHIVMAGATKLDDAATKATLYEQVQGIQQGVCMLGNDEENDDEGEEVAIVAEPKKILK